MNIDEIEANLNSFPSDQKKVLNAILNTVVMNQALLQTLMNVQLVLMEHITPGFDVQSLLTQVENANAEHLVKIFSEISSILSKD